MFECTEIAVHCIIIILKHITFDIQCQANNCPTIINEGIIDYLNIQIEHGLRL